MNKYNSKFSRLGSIGLPIPARAATLSTVQGRYIPYTGSGLAIGSTNTYPQILSDIAANSPTHGAALQKKAKLTYGQGVDFDLLPDDVMMFVNDINANDESINDIISKVSYDLPTYGGFALKIQWTFDKKIASVEHVPFKNVRLGVPNEYGDVEYFIISNDWEQALDKAFRREYMINKYNPSKITEGKVVDGEIVADDVTMDNATQLIYIKTYSTSDLGFYPTPDYVSCLDSCFTEESTGVAMHNQISNGVNGAYVVSTGETVLDDESKQNVIDMFAEFSSGPQNAGGIMFMPTNVKVDKLEALPADLYTELCSEVRQRIISAHGIPSIMLEYSQGGGFNNRAEEYKAAIAVFQETVIKNYQQRIIRVFNGILDQVTSSEYELQIIPFVVDFNKEASITTEVDGEVVSDTTVEVQDSASLSN